MANIPICELEEGLKELVKQPDGIKRLAVVIHEIFKSMENTNADIKVSVEAMFNNRDN